MADVAGFYTLLETPDRKGYVGGLLVTDDIGKPEEFRVTYPVRPTVVQRQLYGRSLLPHIGADLCGKPLFDSLRTKPQILLVQWDYLLGLGDQAPCSVVHVVQRAEQLKLASHTGPLKDRLQPESGFYQPVDVVYPMSYSEQRRRDVLALLAQFFVSIDPLEPFERIRVALKTLFEQDDKFR